MSTRSVGIWPVGKHLWDTLGPVFKNQSIRLWDTLNFASMGLFLYMDILYCEPSYNKLAVFNLSKTIRSTDD